LCLALSQVLELTKLNIAAFSYCRESLADARRAGINLADEIKSCTKWQVICVDPEHLQDKEWRAIAEWPVFRAALLYSAVDEVHLINEWGLEFRPSFRIIGLFFRGCLPTTTSVVGLSATLAPGPATISVCNSLGLFDGAFHLIRRSNERPNVQFIMQTLTHGLTGYEFPDLLPFLSSGRKLVIHCATLDLVFRVYVYIWRMQPPTADKMRRARMYHSLCPSAYNEETIHLIETDPLCQIIIATIAFSNGINAKKILDSISLGFSKTVDITLQEKGRAGREAETVARGIVLVQLSSIVAAMKQLHGLSCYFLSIQYSCAHIGVVRAD
jgi:superfamily II DNA helicase RecQ